MPRQESSGRGPYALQRLTLAASMALSLLAVPLTCLAFPASQEAPSSAPAQRADQEPPEVPGLKQTVGRSKDRYARAEARFAVNAPQDVVWGILTDFPKYPRIFHRVESCRVTRQQGDLVWIESELKPHLFIRTPRQHTVLDLKGKPGALDWKLLDGNFKEVEGHWQLEPDRSPDRCQVIYTLKVDPGPVIPAFLVSFVLRFVQKEIVGSVKQWAETTARAAHPGEGGQPAANPLISSLKHR